MQYHKHHHIGLLFVESFNTDMKQAKRVEEVENSKIYIFGVNRQG
jgi:hypothetical protein